MTGRCGRVITKLQRRQVRDTTVHLDVRYDVPDPLTLAGYVPALSPALLPVPGVGPSLAALTHPVASHPGTSTCRPQKSCRFSQPGLIPELPDVFYHSFAL